MLEPQQRFVGNLHQRRPQHRRQADFVARVGDRPQQVRQIDHLARIVKSAAAIHRVGNAGLVESRAESPITSVLRTSTATSLERRAGVHQFADPPRHPLRFQAQRRGGVAAQYGDDFHAAARRR